jgi:hypothetical protein
VTRQTLVIGEVYLAHPSTAENRLEDVRTDTQPGYDWTLHIRKTLMTSPPWWLIIVTAFLSDLRG